MSAVNASAGQYTYYKRKHNPFIIADSIASDMSRAKRIRNFNDFAVDVNASAVPQWVCECAERGPCGRGAVCRALN